MKSEKVGRDAGRMSIAAFLIGLLQNISSAQDLYRSFTIVAAVHFPPVQLIRDCFGNTLQLQLPTPRYEKVTSNIKYIDHPLSVALSAKNSRTGPLGCRTRKHLLCARFSHSTWIIKIA
jgi:hypothetical protein